MPIVQTEKMRVQWVDTDASSLIHYTAALRYFEVAEHALMRTLFAGSEGGSWETRGFLLPRVHVECDYRDALRYPAEFECSAWIARVGRASLEYGYRAVRHDGVTCLEGRIVAACVGPTGRPMPLPDAARAVFEAAMA